MTATAALVAAAMVGCAVSPAPDVDAAEPPYRIGLIVSETGAGAAFGPQQAEAVEFAVEEINEAGGVAGHPLEVVLRDDESDPEAGRAAMEEVLDLGVVAVIGPTLSLVARAAHPIANDRRTPVIAVSNTADRIVGECDYDCEWIWRDSLGERAAVTANIEAYVLEAAPRTVAVVGTVNDTLAATEVTAAQAALEEAGVEVLAVPSMVRDQTTSRSLIEALATEPDALFIGSSYGDWAAGVMRAARDAGYTGVFLAGNIMNSRENIELAGPAAIGVRSGAAWVLDNRFPANQEFIEAYRRATGEPPSQFGAQAYVAVQVIADALERAAAGDAPIELQREALQEALAETAITTVLGPFRFTPEHDVDQIVWIVEATETGYDLVGFCDPACGAG
ncbi:MAG: ABC transporter substrate-binding protein [Microbacteriaceae bacterium]|nr:ABC transporter substrate-binding protein [Microbacteriaceae bacterium]